MMTPALLPIQTRRLLIRRLEALDVPALVALWTDPEVTRHLGGPRDPVQVREALESELPAETEDPFTLHPVIERATGEVIGDCGLLKKDVEGRDETEIIYVFAVRAWGKGYATEAAAAIRDAARRRLGVGRLIALIEPGNEPSARVAEKIGMRYERSTVRPDGSVRLVYTVLLPADDVTTKR